MNLRTALNALRDAIAADASWQALTGNSGVIVEDPINGNPSLPFACWKVPGSMSQLDLEGLDKVRLDVSYYALTRAACSAMDDYIATNWTIPSGRRDIIASGSYSISGIRRIRSHELPGAIRLQPSGAVCISTVAELELRLRKAV